MADIIKPDLTHIWSSGGAIVAPSDVKIQTGWTAEVPPFQWENWSQNRQDQAISHINQHGIAVWDNKTEYQANRSYTQGPTDGLVYRCVQTHSNQNPETDVSDTYWALSFAQAGTTYTKAEVDAKTTIATTAQAQGLSNNSTLLTPLRLAEAFQGSNKTFTTNNMFQKLPGGMYIQGGFGQPGTDVVQPFLVAFPTAMVGIALAPTASGGVFFSTFSTTSFTSTTGVGQTFRWIAIGY